jgi:hypothetical protein
VAAAKSRPKAEVLRDIEDLGLGSLEDVFNVLKEAALGLRVLVGVDEPKPRGAFPVGRARTVQVKDGRVPKCPHCKRAWFEAPAEVYEIFRFPPDTGIARYLHEHLAGKAKVREEKQTDPIINVLFAADLTPQPELDEIEQEEARQGIGPVDWSKE